MTNLHKINNGKRTRKLLIIISLLIGLVQVRAQQIGSGWTINCTDFSGMLNSGAYEGCNPINGVPDAAHPWQHLLVLRHSNTQNNHQFQLGTSYSENDRIFFRKIASALEQKNTIWNELATRGTNRFIGNQIFNDGSIGIGTDNPLNGLNIFKLNDYNGGSIRFGYSGSYDGLQSFGWNPSTSRDAMKFSYFPHNSLLNQIDLMTLDINGNIGIGTTNPTEKLTIAGGHGDTKLRLYSTGNGSDTPANLSLWASEPGWTFYGTGIGYNVNGNPYYGRIDNTKGSSYVRFLPGETKFEFQNTSGKYINALTIKESGNVGIGTTTINNVQGWNRVVDEYASGHAKLLVRTDNVITGIFSHDTWNGAVGRIGTESPHDLRLMAGYGHEVMSLTISGNVGIGTQNPAYKLDVLGTIRAKEVLVNLDGGADFVFEKDYKLPTIEHVANYVQENKHLPDIPSANEMTKNSVSMGDLQVKLLQKVEELTLYAIQQNSKLQDQGQKLLDQEKKNKELELELKALKEIVTKNSVDRK